MGCVQSQPSSHPSKHHSSSVQARSSQHNPTSKRRSQEFYHQYQPAATPTQPHNYQKTNLSTTNSSSSVITGKENSRQRNVTKNHSKNNQRVPSPMQQSNSTYCDTPRNRNQHSTPAKRNQSSLNNSYAPNKSFEDTEVTELHNTSGEYNRQNDKNNAVTKDGGVKSPKNDNNPEDQAFRRQHFDRNSILRTSKKRSRKSSMNNSTNAGNSTPSKSQDPNSNTSIKDQNKGITPNNRSLSNGKLKGLNNSDVSQTKPFDTQKFIASTNKRADLTSEVNSLYKENVKNMENKNNGIDESRYISNSRNEYNETRFQTFGKNRYCDKNGSEPTPTLSHDSFERNNLFATDQTFNSNSTKLISKQNQETTQNGFDLNESINKETKSFSASDNVAALLGKSITTKNYEPNSSMQPKRIDAKITKLNPAITSNGIKEHTASSGATVIRTRREAMRQAEEEEAAKNTKRHHSSNNGHDNNGRINSVSRRNEKQDNITLEEDCGRLI